MDLSAALIDLNRRRIAVPDGRLYLLLDPYLHEDAPAKIIKGREHAVVRLLERRNVPASKRPVLAALRTDAFDGDEHLLQETLERAYTETSPASEFSGQGRLFGGWLISAQPPRIVAEHLRAVMDQRDTSFVRRYIRLGDPRVSSSLWATLRPAEQAALLGPIEAWFVFDHLGAWHGLSQSSDARAAGPWQATAEQWQLIERMGLVNRLVLTMRREGQSAHADLAHIDSLIRLAKQRGFVSEQDLRTYALYALRYGEACLRHPKVLDWQTQALKQQRLLDDIFADAATPETWQAIADDAVRIVTTGKEGASLYG